MSGALALKRSVDVEQRRAAGRRWRGRGRQLRLAEAIETTKGAVAGKWVNEAEGAARAISRHDTKAEAQARGREVAKKRKVEHHIHNKDGKIAQRKSYGGDPRPSKG